MPAYPDAPTVVLRSLERHPDRDAELRLRFAVTAVPAPVGGAGECSECRNDGPINQAVGEVRYVSTVFRGPITEVVCLPCLPGLLQILHGLGETPLEVALYSPCAGADTPRVKALNHERARLVGLLLATRGPLSVIMLGQMYAAVGARLRRIAEAA